MRTPKAVRTPAQQDLDAILARVPGTMRQSIIGQVDRLDVALDGSTALAVEDLKADLELTHRAAEDAIVSRTAALVARIETALVALQSAHTTIGGRDVNDPDPAQTFDVVAADIRDAIAILSGS